MFICGPRFISSAGTLCHAKCTYHTASTFERYTFLSVFLFAGLEKSNAPHFQQRSGPSALAKVILSVNGWMRSRRITPSIFQVPKRAFWLNRSLPDIQTRCAGEPSSYVEYSIGTSKTENEILGCCRPRMSLRHSAARST